MTQIAVKNLSCEGSSVLVDFWVFGLRSSAGFTSILVSKIDPAVSPSWSDFHAMFPSSMVISTIINLGFGAKKSTMGCGTSTLMVARGTGLEHKRLSRSTITALDANDAFPNTVIKRYGHPSTYKEDGYDFGLRVRVKGNKLSIYVASAKACGTKMTAKESHLTYYPESDAVQESLILSELNHENLPKLRAVFITDISLFLVSISSPLLVPLVLLILLLSQMMDFIDSSRIKNFIDFKNSKTLFNERDVKYVIKSLASAVQYCHDRKIILRNITADSVMVRKTNDNAKPLEVCIADFSFATVVGSSKVLADHPLFDWSDVPYIAPEALVGNTYSTPMDCWSLGILTYLMLTGMLPFASEDDRTLVHSIKTAAFSYPVNLDISSQARYFIGQLLHAEPNERFLAKHIAKDQWILKD